MDESSYLELRDKYVVKSNDLIQKSRFKLNLQQQKAILFLVSQIKPTDDDFQPFTFEIRDFCRICGIDSVGGMQYELLKSALKELSDKSLYIMVDRNVETLVRWLDDVTFYKDKGLVSVRLSKAMKPYLLHLHENFTKYELIYTLRMKHSSTPRLYELLKSYHFNELKPYTVTLDLNELRTRLDAEKKTYQEYKYFKRYIIDPSVKEINEQTDIIVSVTPVKKKRIVYALQFCIQRQKPVDILVNAAETDKLFLQDVAPLKPQQPQKEEVNPAEQPEPERAAPAAQKPDRSQTVTAAASEQRPKQPKVTGIVEVSSTEKPKRLQVRIYITGEKKPCKAFSSYDRADLDHKANQWLTENGYQTYKVSTGTSFRWNV